MAPKATKTALSKAPGSKLAQNLQRVSPGVYRNASGQLTNSGGRPMPGQASRTPSPSVGAIEGAARGVGAALGGGMPSLNPTQRMPRDISGARDMAQRIGAGMRPSMGSNRGMLDGVAAGIGAGLGGGMRPPGNPNFQQTDQQMAGLYDQARQAATQGAGFGQGYGEGMGDMMGQFNEQKDPQTLQAEYQAFVEQQRAMGAANMGEQFGGMAGGFAQGIGAGLGMGMGGSQPGLEQQARSRAEAIARGDMVTADYNPEREALVNQMLPGIRQNMPQGMPKGPAPLPQGMGQGFGQAFGMAAQKRPGTVSGLLQRGPAPRPNPFQNMMQGMGGKKPIPY